MQRSLDEKLGGQGDAVASESWCAGFESACAAVAKKACDEVETEEHCEEEEGLDSVASDLAQQLNNHGKREVREGVNSDYDELDQEHPGLGLRENGACWSYQNDTNNRLVF